MPAVSFPTPGVLLPAPAAMSPAPLAISPTPAAFLFSQCSAPMCCLRVPSRWGPGSALKKGNVSTLDTSRAGRVFVLSPAGHYEGRWVRWHGCFSPITLAPTHGPPTAPGSTSSSAFIRNGSTAYHLLAGIGTVAFDCRDALGPPISLDNNYLPTHGEITEGILNGIVVSRLAQLLARVLVLCNLGITVIMVTNLTILRLAEITIMAIVTSGLQQYKCKGQPRLNYLDLNIFHNFTLKLTDPEFQVILRTYDIMFFSETDMLPGEEETADVPIGYTLISLPRKPRSRDQRRGGGVALLIRNTFTFTQSELNSRDILVLDMGSIWLIV
ncbi:hypothetical protein K438DRAFT_1973936 [Mycena galopus ATCC 62051]|nr:hypothetical protein K438DRAFT_1973936 [Mycena galopus ATCC 62051]